MGPSCPALALCLVLAALVLSCVLGFSTAEKEGAERGGPAVGALRLESLLAHMKKLSDKGRMTSGTEERTMKVLESAQFKIARQRAAELKTEIRGFYHTSAWKKHWKEVVTEQLRIIDGLLRSTDELHVVIADSKGNFGAMHQHIDSLNLRFRKRLHIVYNATIDRKAYRDANADKQALLRKRQAAELISAGEYASITALHNYCTAKVKEGTRAYVYYFHNKGGCCPKYPPSPVSDWRDEMNAFALEFPSICMRALNEGYSTCGVEYQFQRGNHYSGNFFWANCNYVAKLPPLWDPLNNAWDAEFFLFKNSAFTDENKYGDDCGYNPFHCKVHHYNNRCPREMYKDVIKGIVSAEKMPPPKKPDGCIA